MKCNEAKQHIGIYIDGNIDKKTQKAFKEHIEECTDCASLFQFTKKSIDVIQIQKKTENNPFLYESIIAKMENTSTSRSISMTQRFSRVSIAAMLSIMSIAGGTYIGSFGADMLNESANLDIPETYEIMDIDVANNDIDIFRDL